MKNIYFSDKEFKEIKRYNRINRGMEAVIYSYNDDILKVYLKKDLKYQERKINYILRKDKIKGCVMPKGKVYLDEKFIGISMDYYQDYITLGK